MALSFDSRRVLGGVIPAALVALMAMLIVPRFAAIYEPLGGTLPLLTRWIVEGHLLLWLLPILALAVGLAAKDPAKGGRRAVMVGLVTVLAVAPALILALYLPVFNIAATA